MLYSEGSGTRKVGFYGTYPGIKSKNGFAVFWMMIFVPEKKKEKIVYFGIFDDYVKICQKIWENSKPRFWTLTPIARGDDR